MSISAPLGNHFSAFQSEMFAILTSFEHIQNELTDHDDIYVDTYSRSKHLADQFKFDTAS